MVGQSAKERGTPAPCSTLLSFLSLLTLPYSFVPACSFMYTIK